MRCSRPPCDDDGCGWWNVLPTPAAPRRLASDAAADCVVVGAGFTGLAIARRLAGLRPDWRIALVDAQRAGYGASGRSSGFAGFSSHLHPGQGIEAAHRIARISRAGVDALRSLVREHGIPCDWTECGRIHAAAEDRSVRNLERLLPILEATGERLEPMDRHALAAALGTHHYRAGARIPSTVLIQPAALARGLAAALPPNATLYEDSPVRRIRRAGGWWVHAGAGALRAERLFLAVNGYAAQLGVLRCRVFPLLAFASWTRPLDRNEQAQLGDQEQWGVVSEDRLGSTLRRTADGRLLVRNHVRFAPSLRVSPRQLAQIRRQHRRSLAARWPGLAGVEFASTWCGVLGMTRNRGQFFGRLGPELYASIGYNGTGVALGTASGELLADYAVGADSQLLRDALALAAPAWFPPQPFVGWGARSTLALLRWRSGADT